jgi:hypothetical protein
MGMKNLFQSIGRRILVNYYRMLKGRGFQKSRPACKRAHFETMALELLRDVSTVVIEKNTTSLEAKAFLPIVSSVRKRGDEIVALPLPKWRFHARRRHKQLKTLVHDLHKVENLLRNIPRPSITLEDVLKGNFEKTSQFDSI